MRSGDLKRSPWVFIPALYFQQGLPVALVQQFSVILYKRMGISNDQITLWTSLLAWPWIIKMFWGPLIDVTLNKRAWVLLMQVLITLGLFGVAWALPSAAFWPLSLALLMAIAFLSATHDIALDGYYLEALGEKEQALFLGITSSFFRLAMVFCTGAMVILAGLWERAGASVASSWMRSVLVGGALYAGLALYAHWAMPRSSTDRPLGETAESLTRGFSQAFYGFFTQDRAGVILLFILSYRLSEQMLTKMSGLFLLDTRASGGLGLDTVQAGAIVGSCGMFAMVGGGILGGMTVSRFGLRKCLWPMALTMHIPNLLYVWASVAQPGPAPMYWVVGTEQFAYGFGFSSFMVYAMRVCQKSRYQASHYAMVTAVMALGGMFAGILSGLIQSHLGYFWFFVSACVLTLPGMILLPIIPQSGSESSEAEKTQEALAELS